MFDRGPHQIAARHRARERTRQCSRLLIAAFRQDEMRPAQGREAVLLAAAIEGAKTLWLRHAPLGDFHIRIDEINIKNLKASTSEIRMRLEVPETIRQSILGQLRVMNRAQVENHIQFFEEGDQLIAESTLHLTVSTTSLLEAPNKGQNG